MKQCLDHTVNLMFSWIFPGHCWQKVTILVTESCLVPFTSGGNLCGNWLGQKMPTGISNTSTFKIYSLYVFLTNKIKQTNRCVLHLLWNRQRIKSLKFASHLLHVLPCTLYFFSTCSFPLTVTHHRLTQQLGTPLDFPKSESTQNLVTELALWQKPHRVNFM